MNELIAKCGCDCGTCPTYKGNLKTAQDREHCSSGWERYLGVRLSPEKLHPCDGCSIPDEQRNIAYLNCHVRQCAIYNGVANCAYCAAYPCMDLLMVHELQQPDALPRIEARIGGPVPVADYVQFIEPYEGIKHLDSIRATLAPTEINAVKPVSFTPRTVAFPPSLLHSSKAKAAYQQVHQLLCGLDTGECRSYAHKLTRQKRRRQLLRLIWACARNGLLDENGYAWLTLEAKAFGAHKIQSTLTAMEGFCRVFEAHGIHCAIVPLDEKRWLTPKGGLRDEGWLLMLSFDNRIGGAPALKALIAYVARLDAKHDGDGFKHFTKADMSVLSSPVGAPDISVQTGGAKI